MPSVPFVGVNTNGVPLHVTVLIALITGIEFKVTVTVNASPEQLRYAGTTL
jgi:hypothetical protein